MKRYDKDDDVTPDCLACESRQCAEETKVVEYTSGQEEPEERTHIVVQTLMSINLSSPSQRKFILAQNHHCENVKETTKPNVLVNYLSDSLGNYSSKIIHYVVYLTNLHSINKTWK